MQEIPEINPAQHKLLWVRIFRFRQKQRRVHTSERHRTLTIVYYVVDQYSAVEVSQKHIGCFGIDRPALLTTNPVAIAI